MTGGWLRLLACIILVQFGASGPPCRAEPAAQGIASSDAKDLTAHVLQSLGSTIGPVEITTFDEVPRDPSMVNPTSPIDIVVGDSRITPVPGVYSNCTADSARRLVQCDLRVLDDLIDGFDLLYREDQRSATRERIYRLILAHELGHIAHHDPSAGYHGGEAGFSIFKYLHYRIELDADAYAVKLLDASTTDLEQQYGMIAFLSYAAMKKSLCPDTFPANCPCPGYKDATLCSRIAYGPGLPLTGKEQFRVTLAGTHPEFVVRFARLLYLSTYPYSRSIFRPQAEQVLRHIVVKDEHGNLQSTRDLFR